jgi:hypothetical protein
MRCGAPLGGEVLEQRLVDVAVRGRRELRWLMLLVGASFMGLLLWVALRGSYPAWGEPTFWVAVVGIVVVCVVVPHIVWRDGPGAGSAKKDLGAWLMMLAPGAVGVSFAALIWWGGRMAYSLTLGGGHMLEGSAATLMVAVNAGLGLGTARAIEGSVEGRPGWQRARRLTAVLITAQVVVNGVAEVLW